MYGKWLVFLLAVSAATAASCKKVPTAAIRKATPPPVVVWESKPGLTGEEELMLKRAVAAYEWEPTRERAAAVWDAFTQTDARLKELRLIVTSRAGGPRAEAELQRIELQRERDRQMARFAGVQIRMRTATEAFDALASSADPEGIRVATSIVARGLSAETRFRWGGLPTGFAALQAQIP
jgi:acyl-CoA reductase-like NAD-dependent aldehyde dehydrogenase